MQSAFGIDHGDFSKGYMEERVATSAELAGERKKHPIKSKVMPGSFRTGTTYADDNGYRGVMPSRKLKFGTIGPTKKVQRFSREVGGEHVFKMVVKRPPTKGKLVKINTVLAAHKAAQIMHQPTGLKTLNAVHRYG